MATRKETIEVNVTGADKGARDIGKLDRATDQLGDEFRELGRDASRLDRQLEDLRRTQQRLAADFARTGDLGLQRQFAAATRQASALARMQKALSGAARAATPAAGGGARAALGGLSLPVSPTTLGVAGGLGLAAAPAIGAGISAAGLLAGGGLVAGGGIALAASASKPVQDQFKGLGTQIADDATRMALAFEKPLLEVARRTRKEWQDVTDDIDRMFTKVASGGGVQLWAKGLTGLVKEMLPGLEDASDTFDEFGAVAARKLPELGESISDMFSAFERGSPGALAFFEDLLDLTAKTVEGIGNVSFGLSKVYEWMDQVRDDSAWGQLTQGTYGFSEAIDRTEDGMGDLASTTYDATQYLKDLNDQFDTLFDRQMNLDEAALAVTESLREIREAVAENGRTLSESTEAGIENRRVVLGAIEDAARLRDAQIKAGNGSKEATDAANAAYLRQVEEIRGVLRALGMQPAAIDAVIAKYAQIPRDVWTTVHVRADLREINNIAEQMNVRLGRRAAGGPVQAGRPYLVGEEGPELITPTRNGFVHDAAATGNMMGGAVRHILDLRLNGRTIRELVLDEASNRGQSVAAFLGV